MRFAFYGRVSTEDQQDPAASKAWQLSRAHQLVDPHGHEIVEELFDVGLSRSLPWKRRPEASRLLDALRNPRRGFDAVVIGEPARAFYGQQFGLTFPLFEHFDVQLWVPEVGGRVEPGSEAHDMVMTMYGGMSKGERNRVKVRVRAAMATQAHLEGRFLGGRPPYGYRLGDAGAHPNPAKAADGKRLHRLELDQAAAPIVARIFDEWLVGRGLRLIAEGLTGDGVPCPSAHDPGRNRHRRGLVWEHTTVRGILSNPRYTGRQVWNRQRRDEVLVDIDDVALGHETRLRWNDRSDWIWSTEQTHPAIIDPEAFTRAQALLAAPTAGQRRYRDKPSDRTYVLRGLLHCGYCRRRMEGTFANGRIRYRCKYRAEHLAGLGIDHPPTVYLREDAVMPKLDEWLAQVFDPRHLDATVAAMVAAQQPDAADDARAEALRRQIADCDRRIKGYRRALEMGGPATMLMALPSPHEVPSGERFRCLSFED